MEETPLGSPGNPGRLPSPQLRGALGSGGEDGAAFPGRAPDSLDSASLTSLDSSVFCSEVKGSPAPGTAFTVNVGGSRFGALAAGVVPLPAHAPGQAGRGGGLVPAPRALAAVPSPLSSVTTPIPWTTSNSSDRSSQSLRYVLHYYRTGRLHVMEQLCAPSFLQRSSTGASTSSALTPAAGTGRRGAGGGGAGVGGREQRAP